MLEIDDLLFALSYVFLVAIINGTFICYLELAPTTSISLLTGVL